MTALRQSPSGPVIANSNGGTFNPGPGAMLRLVEAQTTAGGSNVIPTAPAQLAGAIGDPGFLVALNAPQVGLEYRATVKCDVLNPSTNVLGEVQLYLETSTDNVTWTERASNTHIVNPTGIAASDPLAREISLELTLKTGSALGVTSSPASGSLFVRAKIGASSGGAVLQVSSSTTPGGDTKSVGTVYLGLSEHF